MFKHRAISVTHTTQLPKHSVLRRLLMGPRAMMLLLPGCNMIQRASERLAHIQAVLTEASEQDHGGSRESPRLQVNSFEFRFRLCK